jgi:hypothetical protein
MALIVYDRAKSPRVWPEYVTIRQHGEIAINNALGKKTGKWPKCRLAYDTDRNALMIKLMREHEDDARELPLRPQRCGGFRIFAFGWREQFGIETEGSTRFHAQYDETKRIVVVELGRPL